jgi:hypothetical protein
MFRRTEQGTDETPTRDEHAYEDNWYRSLKALAEHRAAEEEADLDEPATEAVEANGQGSVAEEPGPEVGSPADAGPASDGSTVAGSEVTLDQMEARLEEVGPQPVDDLPPAVEPHVLAEQPDVGWSEPETTQAEQPDVGWSEPETTQVEEPDVGWSEPETTQVEQPDVGWSPTTNEVEELTVRADHIIERLRTLREADGLEPSPADEVGPTDPDRVAANEELGTRAQNLLERLRTLRSLNDAEGRGSEPGDPQAWG